MHSVGRLPHLENPGTQIVNRDRPFRALVGGHLGVLLGGSFRPRVLILKGQMPNSPELFKSINLNSKPLNPKPLSPNRASLEVLNPNP